MELRHFTGGAARETNEMFALLQRSPVLFAVSWRESMSLFDSASDDACDARSQVKELSIRLARFKQDLVDTETEKGRYRALLEKDSKEQGSNEMERAAWITTTLAADHHYTDLSKNQIDLKAKVALLEIDIDWYEKLHKESLLRMQYAISLKV